MRPVFQTVVGNGLGNCHQAVVASLFELELDMVPNFIKYKKTEPSLGTNLLLLYPEP